ncbi:uncharacterized protein LOC144090593 isoform X2 [Stigmatopora argus]
MLTDVPIVTSSFSKFTSDVPMRKRLRHYDKTRFHFVPNVERQLGSPPKKKTLDVQTTVVEMPSQRAAALTRPTSHPFHGVSIFFNGRQRFFLGFSTTLAGGERPAVRSVGGG